MLFVSPLFLFVVLPTFVLVCLFARGRSRNALLLALSLLFYAWGEPRLLPVVLASSVLDWGLAGWIGRATNSRIRRLVLGLGVAQNVLLLGFFKYATFFRGQVDVLLGAGEVAPPTALATAAIPLGISFIALERITYVVDVYRGASRPTTLLRYLTYVFLFPKLLAGPIVKLREIAAQIENPIRRPDDARAGFVRFCQGMAKKLFVADVLGLSVTRIFAAPVEEIGTVNAWLGLTAFVMQIYYDFSAYSDMAIGLARIAGFRLRENFDMPFRATSIREFWQRWHISLTSWLTQYLYLPITLALGRRLRGTRLAGAVAPAAALLCGAVSGLWHGADWTFVLWGLSIGILLVLDHGIAILRGRRAGSRLGRVVVTACFVLGGVLFRAPTLEHAWGYYGAMFTWSPPERWILLQADFFVTLAVAWFFAFVAPSSVASALARTVPAHAGWRLARGAGFAAFLLVTLARAAASTPDEFLYFRF